MATPPSKAWQHPWLRVTRMIRTILHRPWSAEQWCQLEPEIPKLLAEQRRIRQEGWFN
jgi:hypothetical protein